MCNPIFTPLKKEKIQKILVIRVIVIKLELININPKEIYIKELGYKDSVYHNKKEMRFCTYVKLNFFNSLNINKRVNNKSIINIFRNKLLYLDKIKDYRIVLKSINEVNLLKKLIFDENQLACFNYVKDKNNFIAEFEAKELDNALLNN